MIRHLWKLIWNRKKNNLLIVLEIFVSFLVVFAVTVTGIYYLDNYRNPLGFSYREVWDIVVVISEAGRREWTDFKTTEIRDRMNRLVHAVEEFQEISGVTFANMAPYDGGSWKSGYESKRTSFTFSHDQVSDPFPEVIGLQLIRGRWFDKRDDGLNFDPVLVSRQFAEMAFGAEDPIGKSLDEDDRPEKTPARIVGVFSDYRKQGELAELEPFVLYRSDLSDTKQTSVPGHILIRIRPGTPLSFEEKLVARMQSMERGWSFEVQPIEVKRHDWLTKKILPLIIVGIVAASMMLMVGSGILGVLWLSITRRTQEIGLRRAQGASAQNIYGQILLEVFLISSVGLGLGWFVILQLPLMNLVSFLQTRVLLYGIVSSSLLIYSLVLLCALYPAYMATRVQPAEALHYE